MTITVSKAALSALQIQVKNAQQELYQTRLAIAALLLGEEIEPTDPAMQGLLDNIEERETMETEEEECYT